MRATRQTAARRARRVLATPDAPAPLSLTHSTRLSTLFYDTWHALLLVHLRAARFTVALLRLQSFGRRGQARVSPLRLGANEVLVLPLEVLLLVRSERWRGVFIGVLPITWSSQ